MTVVSVIRNEDGTYYVYGRNYERGTGFRHDYLSGLEAMFDAVKICATVMRVWHQFWVALENFQLDTEVITDVLRVPGAMVGNTEIEHDFEQLIVVTIPDGTALVPDSLDA